MGSGNTSQSNICHFKCTTSLFLKNTVQSAVLALPSHQAHKVSCSNVLLSTIFKDLQNLVANLSQISFGASMERGTNDV